MGSVGVERETAASKDKIGDFTGIFPGSAWRVWSIVFGRPFPGTTLFIPLFLGLTILNSVEGGINFRLDSASTGTALAESI